MAPAVKEGHDLQPNIQLCRVHWEIASRSVSLPSDKHLRPTQQSLCHAHFTCTLVNKCTVASITDHYKCDHGLSTAPLSSGCAIELSS